MKDSGRRLINGRAALAALDGDAAAVSEHQYENGHHRILQWALLDGKRVQVDLRFVGDDYYCKDMEKALLDTRIRRDSFYVPDPELYLFSLMYHAIVHKRDIAPSYTEDFIKLGLPPGTARSRPALMRLLRNYMILNNFTFVKPEPSVFFNVNY